MLFGAFFFKIQADIQFMSPESIWWAFTRVKYAEKRVNYKNTIYHFKGNRLEIPI